MEEKQKKVPAVKKILLVDVILERKGSQIFERKRVQSTKDTANIIRDFIGDSDREEFVVHILNSSNNFSDMGICTELWNTHSFYY